MPLMTLRFPVVACVALAIVLALSGSSIAAQVATPGTPVPSDEPAQPSIDFFPAGESAGGFFDVELEPGGQATLTVAMGNSGSVDFDAVTYAADAYTIRNGGFGLRDLDSEPTGPTTWLDYPTEEFTATVGEMTERDFTIAVPDGTPPGEYVTGVAMQTADPVNVEAGEGMFRFDQYYRTVIGVRILVPGDLAPELELGEPAIVEEGGITAISIPVTNTGNQQTQPSGEIRISDADGDIALSAPIQMGRIYGGHETELWLGLSAPLPEGEYAVDLTLSDPDRNLSVEMSDATLTVAAPASPVAPAPITITSAAVEPGPSADSVQFAVVDATISNTGDPVTNAQLSLLVFKDGEEVERFPISQSLALPQGDTSVNTRYIPLEGWSSGEWSFELLLETVDPNGAAVVVASQPIEGSITVP